MASITINGRTVTGERVTVRGNRVTVDGEDVGTGDAPRVTIEIHGNVESIQAESCERLAVHGQVGDVSVVSGNVNCCDIAGKVSTTSGNVNRR
ncbi:hypothetical protein [Caballeronia sp. Lep1P3]|uniref:hypothetical protein n=1 Tax=Caballeronia sp. Lep1P3 TaxID=2878150 RepID=UPI001FD0D13F|nr:hypothetical protein [Caballeronia sp. Lep1P3]